MSGRGQAGSSSWEYGSSWDGWDYGYGGSWDEGEEQGEEVGKGKGGGRRTTVQAKGRQGGMALRARFEDGTQERTRTQAEREAIRAPLLRDIKDLKARLATAQSEGDHAVRELTLCQAGPGREILSFAGFNKDYKQRAEMAEGRLRQANLDLMAAKAAEEVLETSKADYKKQLEDCKTMVTSLEASLTAKEKELHAAQACSDEKDKELKEAQAKEKELRAAQACIDEKDKELKEAQAALQQKDKDLRAIQENKAKWKLEAHAMKHARKEVARMVENDMLVRCNTLLARKAEQHD
ncbi:unnamed protein product [Symbiodinium sp. CCMP2592]|nr:unnamed protein product [Symbiodinium sp. CCMP2592]